MSESSNRQPEPAAADATETDVTGVDEDRATGGETAGADPAEDPPDEPLPLDVVFGILKNRRRRLVLRYLDEVSETTSLSDLSEYIAAIENDKEVEALSSSERKRVYVGLYQGHLPRLDDADVVDFDDDRGTVRVAKNAPQVMRYLDSDEESSPSQPRHILGVAAGAVVALGVQQVVVPEPALTVTMVVVALALFAVVSLDDPPVPQFEAVASAARSESKEAD